jgi:NADP-dependent 3-hydroxy acid dehydrogenase YdfG
MELTDRVVLVTGGGGAIAGSIVRTFAGAGARVVVVGHQLEHARAAAAEVGALPLAADLTTADGAAAMVRGALDGAGGIDALIHTVGGYAAGRIEELDATAYENMFDLNVRTLFHAVRAVLPELRARNGGFIAGFSSEPAWTGAAPGASLYAAAKSAVATFLRSLDGELAGTDISVSIVYPMGAVDTPANRRAMPGLDPSTLIDPSEIAATLLHAATRSRRGRLLELPVFSARR